MFVASSSSPPLVRALVFLPTGIVLLVAAVLVSRNVRSFIRHSETAPGTVIRLNAGSSHPEISFRLRDGRTFSFPQGGLIGGYAPGQRVVVRYAAVDPQRTACLDVWGALWFWFVILTILGSGCTLGGLGSAREMLSGRRTTR